MTVNLVFLLSTMINTISLLITERCNLRCAHCILGANPSLKNSFPVEWISSVIEGIHRAGIQRLGITGGEPFLESRLLEKTLNTARSMGINVILSTSGYWAKNTTYAIAHAKKLASLGVTLVLLSADEYHQEYIPLSNISNAVNAICDSGLEYEVHVTARNVETANYFVSALRELGVSKVAVGGIERAGRASTLPAIDGAKSELMFECAKLDNPLILTSGDVIACCDLLVAPEFRPEPGSLLHLGNLRNEPIDVIIDRTCNNIVLQHLRKAGPDGLWMQLCAKNPRLAKSMRHDLNGCHLCYWMLAKRINSEMISAVLSSSH